MMKKLYKFNWGGYYGKLTGVFVAESSDVDDAIGSDVYFGDALGKHSDVMFELTSNMIIECSNDPKFIKKFEDLVGESGYNPLDYLVDEDDGDWDAEDDEDEDELLDTIEQ